MGLLEQVPQRINERPPYFVGRDELETLMASNNCSDWVRIRYHTCPLSHLPPPPSPALSSLPLPLQ